MILKMRGFFLFLLVSARKPEFSGDHDRGWTDAETTQEHWRNLGRVELERMLAIRPNLSRAKNVVLFMGDGMGMPTVTAGRIMRGQKNSQNGESYRTRMEQFDNVGYSKTYNIGKQIKLLSSLKQYCNLYKTFKYRTQQPRRLHY